MSEPLSKWPDAIHVSGHAAAACYFGWPMCEVSIQATKTSEESRIDFCRLGIEPLPKETPEDILRSIIYQVSGPAAEYLFGIESPAGATTGDYAEAEKDAERVFPENREGQKAMMKQGDEAAMEVVRSHRSGIEALANALMRLERVEGTTARQFIHSGRKDLRS